ncbi:hypothetical protein ACIBSW_38065 [Actinoplanes sp. NPDC049668]|uniref:AMIN-like domain-containing (lipo)protein n=1 Tax=unclassified Actinoplanes TaxID=2626549 RepID=UPI0033A2BD84
MRMSVGRTFLVATLCLALAACGDPATGGRTPAATSGQGAAPAAAQAAQAEPALAAAPYCGITWGSAEKKAGSLSTAPLLTVETGRHECWDRVVFEFNGAAQGYQVRYSATVPTDGEGVDLVPYTAGEEHLWVTLLAPAYDANNGSTIDARDGDRVANVLRYDTLRDVVFGGSFEGYTTFAVGVRARLPFRVTLLAGPGTHSRIVLDIAHRW